MDNLSPSDVTSKQIGIQFIVSSIKQTEKSQSVDMCQCLLLSGEKFTKHGRQQVLHQKIL